MVIPGSNRLLTLCEVEVYGYPAPDGENMNIYDQDLHSVALIKVSKERHAHYNLFIQKQQKFNKAIFYI